MLLFYIRHGDPIYNPDSLTPLGMRQAEAIAKRLALYGVDSVYASTSNRAIETSKPTCELLKKQPQLLDFCNEGHAWKEFAFPDKNGVTCWAFAQNDFVEQFVGNELYSFGEKWYDHPKFKEYRFKEGMERINSESDKFLSSLGYEHDRSRHMYNAKLPNDKRIALFAHQGFGVLFLSSILDIPYPQFCTHFDITHSGMTVIEFPVCEGYVVPKVLTLSNDSHIYKEGLPTNYNNRIRF